MMSFRLCLLTGVAFLALHSPASALMADDAASMDSAIGSGTGGGGGGGGFNPHAGGNYNHQYQNEQAGKPDYATQQRLKYEEEARRRAEEARNTTPPAPPKTTQDNVTQENRTGSGPGATRVSEENARNASDPDGDLARQRAIEAQRAALAERQAKEAAARQAAEEARRRTEEARNTTPPAPPKPPVHLDGRDESVRHDDDGAPLAVPKPTPKPAPPVATHIKPDDGSYANALPKDVPDHARDYIERQRQHQNNHTQAAPPPTPHKEVPKTASGPSQAELDAVEKEYEHYKSSVIADFQKHINEKIAAQQEAKKNIEQTVQKKLADQINYAKQNNMPYDAESLKKLEAIYRIEAEKSVWYYTPHIENYKAYLANQLEMTKAYRIRQMAELLSKYPERAEEAKRLQAEADAISERAYADSVKFVMENMQDHQLEARFNRETGLNDKLQALSASLEARVAALKGEKSQVATDQKTPAEEPFKTAAPAESVADANKGGVAQGVASDGQKGGFAHDKTSTGRRGFRDLSHREGVVTAPPRAFTQEEIRKIEFNVGNAGGGAIGGAKTGGFKPKKGPQGLLGSDLTGLLNESIDAREARYKRNATGGRGFGGGAQGKPIGDVRAGQGISVPKALPPVVGMTGGNTPGRFPAKPAYAGGGGGGGIGNGTGGGAPLSREQVDNHAVQ